MTWINQDVNTLTSPDRLSFKIGDVDLDIPPQAITVSRQENHNEMGYLRAPGTVKIPTGQAVIRIDVDFVVATDESYEGAAGGEGKPLRDLEILSRLVAMTRVTPFVPVRNAYLTRHIPLGEPAIVANEGDREKTAPIPCAITALSIAASGDAPALLNCHLSLIYWNPEPFAGEEKIVWTLRADDEIAQHYQPYIDNVIVPSLANLESQNPNSVVFKWHQVAAYGELSRALGLIENATVGRAGENDVKGPAQESRGVKTNTQATQVSRDNVQIIEKAGWARVDPTNRNVVDPLFVRREPEEINVTPVPIPHSPVNQVAVGISIAFQNRLALLPLQGCPYPTIQHLGAADTEVQLSLVVKSLDEDFAVASDLEKMLHVMSKRALRYRGKVFSGRDMRAISYVGVLNPLLAACGLQEFVVGSTTLERDPESAELVRVDVSLSEIPWAGESEAESMIVYNTTANFKWARRLVELATGDELTKRDIKDPELAKRIANVRRFIAAADEALKKNHEIYPHYGFDENPPVDKLPSLDAVVPLGEDKLVASDEKDLKKGKIPDSLEHRFKKEAASLASMPVYFADFPNFGILRSDNLLLSWFDKHDCFPVASTSVSLIPSTYFEAVPEKMQDWIDALMGNYPESLGGHFERNMPSRLTKDGAYFGDLQTASLGYGGELGRRASIHFTNAKAYLQHDAATRSVISSDPDHGEGYVIRRGAEEFLETYMLAMNDAAHVTVVAAVMAAIMRTPAAMTELRDIADKFVVDEVPGAPCYRDLFLMNLKDNPYDWIDNGYSQKMALAIKKTQEESIRWIEEVVLRSRNAIAENQGTYYTPKTMDYDPSLFVDEPGVTDHGKTNYTGEFSIGQQYIDNHGVADASAYANPLPGVNRINDGGHFGDPRDGHTHAGVDLPAHDVKFYAAANGVVQHKEYPRGVGYGIELTIFADDGTAVIYGHLSHIAVADGTRVSKGDYLGLTGNTGHSTGPHLHFEVHDRNGNPVDPTPIITGQRATLTVGATNTDKAVRGDKSVPASGPSQAQAPAQANVPARSSAATLTGAEMQEGIQALAAVDDPAFVAFMEKYGWDISVIGALDQDMSELSEQFWEKHKASFSPALRDKMEKLLEKDEDKFCTALAHMVALKAGVSRQVAEATSLMDTLDKIKIAEGEAADAGNEALLAALEKVEAIFIKGGASESEIAAAKNGLTAALAGRAPTSAIATPTSNPAGATAAPTTSGQQPGVSNAKGDTQRAAINRGDSAVKSDLVKNHINGVIAYNAEAPRTAKEALSSLSSMTTDQFTVRRCFPAFKFYFVEDNDQGIVHALDEFYAWNAVLDWKLSEAAHRPATLMVTVSNMFNHLDAIVLDANSPRAPEVLARTGGYDPTINLAKTPLGSFENRPEVSAIGSSPVELEEFDYQVDDGGERYLDWIDADTGERQHKKQIDVEIEDGDSLNIVRGGKKVDQIRFFGIDAEEVDHSTFGGGGFTAQPYGEPARKRLRELVQGKNVHIETRFREPFGRIFGEIFVDGQSVNLQLVREGLARATPPTCGPEYMEAEAEAREAGRGLWAQGGAAVHPGSWRHSVYHARMRPIETKGGDSPTGVYTQDEDKEYVQNLNHIMLKPGTKVVLKAGYNNDPDKLETIFAGEVTEVDSGEVMTIVCQDWGFELTHVFDSSPEVAKVLTDDEWFGWIRGTKKDAQGLMSCICAFRAFLSQPCCRHLGRWEISQRDEANFGAFDWKLSDTFRGADVKGEAGSRALINIKPIPLKYYSPLTDVPLHDRYLDTGNVDKGTMWDLAEEMRHVHVNSIFAVRPYGAGNGTVYFGAPWGYYAEDSAFARLTTPQQQALSRLTFDAFVKIVMSATVDLDDHQVKYYQWTDSYAPEPERRTGIGDTINDVGVKIAKNVRGKTNGETYTTTTAKLWQVLHDPQIILYMLQRIAARDDNVITNVEPLLRSMGVMHDSDDLYGYKSSKHGKEAIKGRIYQYGTSYTEPHKLLEAPIESTPQILKCMYEIYTKFLPLASAQSREAPRKTGGGGIDTVDESVESMILVMINVVNTRLNKAVVADAAAAAAKAEPDSLEKARLEAVANATGAVVKPIRKLHIVTSRHHIVSNGMVVSQDFSNAVSVDGDIESTCSYDGHLMDRRYRNFATILGSTSKEKKAIRGYMAASMLADQFRTMYRGEIILTGDPTIRPHDLLHIVDENRQIFGVVEVDRVVHSMDFENGFITVVTPALLTEVSDMTWIQAYEAYYCALAKQMDQLRQMGDKTRNFVGVIGGKTPTQIANTTEWVASVFGDSPATTAVEQSYGGTKIGIIKPGGDEFGPLRRMRNVSTAFEIVGGVGATVTTIAGIAMGFNPLLGIAVFVIGGIALGAHFAAVLNTTFCGYARAHCINFAPVVKRGVGWFAGIEGANGGTYLGQFVLDMVASVQQIQKYADLYHVYATSAERFTTEYGMTMAAMANAEK